MEAWKQGLEVTKSLDKRLLMIIAYVEVCLSKTLRTLSCMSCPNLNRRSLWPGKHTRVLSQLSNAKLECVNTFAHVTAGSEIKNLMAWQPVTKLAYLQNLYKLTWCAKTQNADGTLNCFCCHCEIEFCCKLILLNCFCYRHLNWFRI